MVDFRQHLSKPMAEMKKAPTLPGGTYKGVIISQEFGESSKKKTPYCRYNVRLLQAMDDVDASRLADDGNGKPIDIQKKSFRSDFYLTDEAEYRLVEFLKTCGVEVGGGRSLGEGIPDALNAPVIVNLSEELGEGGSMFNQIKEIKGEHEVEE